MGFPGTMRTRHPRFDLKQFDQAIEDFNGVLGQEPTRDDGYYMRGYAWFEKKEYGKAINDLTEAIVLDPEDSGTSWRYWLRGICWRKKAR